MPGSSIMHSAGWP